MELFEPVLYILDTVLKTIKLTWNALEYYAVIVGHIETLP